MNAVGFVGASGSGKTTLIEMVLPVLRRNGFRVSTLKHAHHGFDIDRSGKDSYRHREAGAEEVMLVSERRFALLREWGTEDDFSFEALLRRMAPVDLLLVEGYKDVPIPKIEVYRPCLGKSALFPNDPGIVAVASDLEFGTGGRKLLSLNDAESIADFIMSLAMVSA